MTAATARASPPPLPCTGPPSVRWERLPCPNRKTPRMIAASAVTFTRVVTSLTAAPTRAPNTLAPVRMMIAIAAIIILTGANVLGARVGAEHVHAARLRQQRAQLRHRQRSA